MNQARKFNRRQAGQRYGSAAPPAREPWEGILLVDKPGGWTSHDVVAKLRNHFKIKKVGHGGTLDPMATGLLVILLGRGTKLSEKIMGSDKTYEGTMRLGQVTDSHDADGEIIEESDPTNVTEEALLAAMNKWTGDIMQVPPMVSAIKKDGVALYKLARKGKTIEREPRFLHIYSFTPTRIELPEADFRVSCTKGTYVRTLCHDVGTELGCGAHLSRLCRTRSGGLTLDKASSLDDLLKCSLEDLADLVIAPEQLPPPPPPGHES